VFSEIRSQVGMTLVCATIQVANQLSMNNEDSDDCRTK
jgi:hypothetical protein